MDPNVGEFLQQELVILGNIQAQFTDCVLSPQGGFLGKESEQPRSIMPVAHSFVPYKAMNAWDATTWYLNTTQQGTYGSNNPYNPRQMYVNPQ
jgi:hypothetical protein